MRFGDLHKSHCLRINCQIMRISSSIHLENIAFMILCFAVFFHHSRLAVFFIFYKGKDGGDHQK